MEKQTSLADQQRSLGAQLASDGIPLHFGDQRAEYEAALHAAVVMDRSHEARLRLSGRDHLALIQRISTNDVLTPAGDGRPTLFTNPNGRILERATLYHRDDKALLISEPGRGDSLRNYLQRNIFFNDQMQIEDQTPVTRLFTLHGPQADAVVANLLPTLGEGHIAGQKVFVARRKPLSHRQWIVVVEGEAAPVWSAILAAGQPHGLRPAGSLVYNALRIAAGRPAAGRELTSDYIPLEIGLWDEVSFSKGCYTGQEIIARMESRRRLARTIVSVMLDRPLDAPADLLMGERKIGVLTSSVTTPTDDRIGIAILKVSAAKPGAIYRAGDTQVTVIARTGVQPAVEEED